ncbi:MULTISPECIES: helix-turn-helix domain-containing protein [Vibrio harveyi group]|uniref:hypothetical protein n=1 Tax=Vibrio harveyi group TaxID=717610 RepID=UPI001F087DB1|nr:MULTISPECIES: hypothetical protein [Vibrio harveyi group]MEA5376654.1 hypothetical protein [Vibrio parahaemolyticus]UMM06728.1 hypothetical protein MKR81_26060 [Vibrio campbellii]
MAYKKIRCEIRCLEPATVRAAKRAMMGAVISKVPFVCKVSGQKEENLLLSDDRAQYLAALPDALGGPLTQKILYAILGAELCECDIVTLTDDDEGRVLNELERLRINGIVTCRAIEGMTYYSLGNANVKDRLTKHLADMEAL